MPVNRNALVRYKTIDQCLRNRYRRWTLNDLVEACSEALYEYEGIDKGVSQRTVQLDLQTMRSEKLGYSAPIIVTQKKYYTYADAEYSITNIPLTDQDLNKLTEVITVLKQFKGFTHFHELSGMVQKLENKVHTEKTKQESVIQFETNEHLKGLEFIDALYQAILQRRTVRLTYQSFKARNPQCFDFHAQLLKEFRNRWFVLGFKGERQLPLLLALDRVVEVAESSVPYVANTSLNLQEYFRHVVGVSVEANGRTERLEIFVEQAHLPYLLTKPIHHSQQLQRKIPGGGIITLDMQLNFELEKELLGYGETIKVLHPPRLVRRLKKRVALTHRLYTYDLHPVVAQETIKRVNRRGTAVLDGVYSPEEVKQIVHLLEQHKAETPPDAGSLRIDDLMTVIPALEALVFSRKLHTLVKEGMGETYVPHRAVYTEGIEEGTTGDWYQDREADVSVEVLKSQYIIRIHLDTVTAGQGALRVYPKSHFDVHDSPAITALRQAKSPTDCEVAAGGIHLLKPLTLRSRPACQGTAIELLFGIERTTG